MFSWIFPKYELPTQKKKKIITKIKTVDSYLMKVRSCRELEKEICLSILKRGLTWDGITGAVLDPSTIGVSSSPDSTSTSLRGGMRRANGAFSFEGIFV
jgi:hypothetical protein